VGDVVEIGVGGIDGDSASHFIVCDGGDARAGFGDGAWVAAFGVVGVMVGVIIICRTLFILFL
jgi:hypothetical protein